MFSRKLVVAGIAAAALYADLPSWISTIEFRNKLEDVFYRTVTFGSNTVAWRKPPKETRPGLTQQIQQSPAEVQLYYLRAREAEAQLDFGAAENDWAKYVELSGDKAQAWREKAAFHRRRVEPEKELAALLESAKLPGGAWDRYRPASKHFAWAVFEDALKVANEHLLEDARYVSIWSEWEKRYPSEFAVYDREAGWLAGRKRWSDVEALIGRYAKAFPSDEAWPLRQRAVIENGRGNAREAVAIYERNFRPGWPSPMLGGFFAVLDGTDSRRAFVAAARQQLKTNPGDFSAAAKLFHHYQNAGDGSNGRRVLHDFGAHASNLSAADQILFADFHAYTQNHQEAARRYQAIYAGNTAQSEEALARLIALLINQAGQPFAFGGGDLGFYRDIATLDTAPGFWNGILSLVLNGQTPAADLGDRERKAAPYFHRAAAAELLGVFDTRFPQSARRAHLHSLVIEASAIHAEADRVSRLGNGFLNAFKTASERTTIALLTADAHARQNQTAQEFAIYETLLDELSARADRVPIGENGTAARSVDYPRVLDRYIARLSATRQATRALALYFRELDRNPNDPGLYEKVAGFLDQNRMAAEIEGTYRRALQQFNDKSWSHKLARYFLRQKMNAKFDELTKQVAGSFSGLELEEYLRVSAQQGSLDPVLYLQVNRHAHQRFPHHIPFVKNLISAYLNKATYNDVERERLLRTYWMHDETLRDAFFQHLSAAKKLEGELAALQAQSQRDAAASKWLAEAEAWRGHFEIAAPLLKTLAVDYPADVALVSRTASMHRSLATWDARNLDAAIQLEETLAKAHPSNTAILTRLGEMQADRERYDLAAPHWNRIPALRPGSAAGYLESATLFWDYYRFDDALARIEDSRKRLGNPRLFAFEAGAIRENQGNFASAAREYVNGAIAEEGDSNARQRLIRVATRPQWHQPVQAALAQGGSLSLRVALLESQGKRAELETLLTQAVAGADNNGLAAITAHAQRNGMKEVERRVLARQLALAVQPAERMQAIAARLRFEDSAGNGAGAAQEAESLLRENGRSMGAIRTAVNYYSRSNAKARAARILLAAAPNAYPELRRQFQLEAIQKLIDGGDYAAAHGESAKLLAADPIDERVLALEADAYARAKDDRSLSTLYRDAIAQVQKSSLPPPSKMARVALLRRGWIPALLRMNDATGASDQYIELLKAYPEDVALLGEASRNAQRERLTAYFAKAEQDSPKDARWPIVRARLEQESANYDVALAAWGRAVVLRPERVDLLASRASLEERLGRFDEAVASRRKLYEISFKNGEWLVQGARVLARQGRNDECVKWLREGLVDNRPASANNSFALAEHLLGWGLVEQARVAVAQGMAIATPESDLARGAALAARAAVRLRQFDQLDTLVQPATRHVVAAGQTAWRDAWVRTAAETAATYLTPDEKQKFGAWLEASRGKSSAGALASAATAAGVSDVAVRILHAAMLSAPGSNAAASWTEELVRLQNQRQQFNELGRQLEAYHRVYPNRDEKGALLHRARSAYFQGGDEASELRLLVQLGLDGELSERYFELRLSRAPVTLTPAQRANNGLMDQFANHVLKAGRADVSTFAITGRRSPQWQNAMRALTALYFAENSPAARKAFLDVVGPDRIGEKLALAGNRDAQLAGDTWFYYAGRYGAWLQVANDSAAPHYLAAEVELSSNSANAYIRHGEEAKGAVAENAFRTALLLDPHQPIAYARLAKAGVDSGANWRKTFEELSWWQNNRRVPEWFWEEASGAMRESRTLRAEMRPAVDQLLRGYVKRNGAYRVRELLEAAVAFSATPAEGVAWIAEIAQAAGDPGQFLNQVNSESSWIPAEGREALLRAQLASSEARLAKTMGEEREFVRGQVDEARLRYCIYLAENGKLNAARAHITRLSENAERRNDFAIADLRVKLAVLDNRLEAELDSLQVSSQTLRGIASSLDAGASRVLRRRAFDADLRNGEIDTAYLGLAELEFESGETAKGLALLKAYMMNGATPFDRHQRAGDLLMKHKRTQEAAAIYQSLAQAEPWNWNAAVALAEAKGDENSMGVAVGQSAASYEARLRAARWIRVNKKPAAIAAPPELSYIAGGDSAVQAAEQPYWLEGRMLAAAASKDTAIRARLYRGALAVKPGDSAAALELFRVLAAAGRWREAVVAIDELAYSVHGRADRELIANAFVRANQGPRASGIYQVLASGETDPAKRRTLEQAIAAINARVARDAANDARRPVVNDGLEQDRIVKPRLTAQGGSR
ncbi:MAG: hypothetical protein FJW38_12085 [Acidobacteria bacterium]|nr:hypothetical protein [Acidobacteriota bacterium]